MLTIENFKEQVEKQVICKLSNNGDYETRYESKTTHLTFVPIFNNCASSIQAGRFVSDVPGKGRHQWNH